MARYVSPRATCPACGRTNTPLRVNGTFFAHVPWGGGVYCYGPTEVREENMSGTSVEYLLERRKLLDSAIERKILEEERFGTDTDYAPGVILVIDVDFRGGGPTYTYVVLKVRNDYWFCTAKAPGYKTFTWAQLVDNLLSKAEAVHIVTKLEEL